MDVGVHWDENADRWASYVRRGWDAYREHFNNPAFFSFLGDVTGLDVLDAGCGEGHNTRLLARHAASVTGIDISERMVELARQAEKMTLWAFGTRLYRLRISPRSTTRALILSCRSWR